LQRPARFAGGDTKNGVATQTDEPELFVIAAPIFVSRAAGGPGRRSHSLFRVFRVFRAFRVLRD
jgi:hypothetical protein